MRLSQSARRRLSAAFIVLLVATTAATGCGGGGIGTSTNRLREAQESFNQAATAENSLRFDDQLQEGPVQGQLASNTAIQNGYASALLSLGKIEQQDVERLKTDKLWGNVLALKALTQWKLGLLDQARQTAAEAQQAGADQLLPRDQALLLALPGLIKVDEAFAALQRVPTDPSAAQRATALQNVQLLVSDAVNAIDKGRVAAGTAHPVQVYLIQAELAAFRNLQFAHEALGEGDDRTLPAAKRADAQRLLKELKCQTEKLKAPDTIVGYWTGKLTLTPEPGPC
jgi:hypothetical protein